MNASKNTYRWKNIVIPPTQTFPSSVSNDAANDCFSCLNYTIHILNWGKNIVVGDGLMAKAFLGLNLDKNVLIFASGVSNSNEERQSAFDQEKKLFLEIHNKFSDHTIVYFSSCSVFDPWLKDKPYVYHKKGMESLISETAKSYYIFRLPIMVWKSQNPNTLVNNLHDNIIKEKQFNLWKHAKRHLIDIDDVYTIIHYLLREESSMNTIINVAFSQYTILDIVQALEKVTGKKALYTLTDQWWSYDIDTSTINDLPPHLQPRSDTGCRESRSDINYLESILRKHYSNREL